MAIPTSYLILAGGLFVNAWLSTSESYPGSIPDVLQSMWFLSWAAHALAAHQSLLFTHALNAPLGINLLWNSALLLPGTVLAPITARWGPLVAYDVFITLAVASSAWAAYFAIRRLVSNGAASWLGGLLFGFSPYMVAQSLGHVDLVMMVYVPLSLWFFVELLVLQRRRWWALGGGFGALTAAQYFVFPEVLVGVAIAFAAGILATALQYRSLIRERAGYAAKGLAVAGVVVLVLAGWAVWYQATGPQAPPGLSEVANATGNDLLAFLTPTPNQALSPGFARTVAASFAAQATGQDAYVGIPFIAFIAIAFWAFRGDQVLRLLTGVAGFLMVLSLGSWLTVGGHTLPVPLPWIMFQHIPLIDNLVPLRLVGYADLLLAAVVARALSRYGRIQRWQRTLLVTVCALLAASWLPAMPRPTTPLPSPAALPPALVASLSAQAVVLFVPYPSLSNADAMYYQAQAGFSFSLTAGYAYGEMPELPLQAALGTGGGAAIRRATVSLQSAGAREAVLQRLRALEITDVVVPPGQDAADRIAMLTQLFQARPQSTAGFAHWTLGGS